ncbi:MAG: IS21-like element helper ATPase IstB [Acidobacteriaceae bacterium]
MNLIELNRSLVQLRLSGMAAVMETRLLQAQSENMAPIDLISTLVSDELACRSKRLLERRHKQAQFRDADKRLDNFDFQFNARMNRNLVFELATANWIGKREDALFLGPSGTGKTHLAIALGTEAIVAANTVYFLTIQDLVAQFQRARDENKLKERMTLLVKPKLLILDEMGYLSLDPFAATCLFQLVSERYEKGSIILTSNKSYGDWGAIFADNVIASAILDRLLHHSTTINIKGESCQLKDKKKAGAVAAKLPGKEGG